MKMKKEKRREIRDVFFSVLDTSKVVPYYYSCFLRAVYVSTSELGSQCICGTASCCRCLCYINTEALLIVDFYRRIALCTRRFCGGCLSLGDVEIAYGVACAEVLCKCCWGYCAQQRHCCYQCCCFYRYHCADL